MINPPIRESRANIVRRYGIDNHPGGSINLPERINRAERGRLARRPWATMFFFFTLTYYTDILRERIVL